MKAPLKSEAPPRVGSACARWLGVSVVLLVIGSLATGTEPYSGPNASTVSRALALFGDYVVAFVVPGVFVAWTSLRKVPIMRFFLLACLTVVPLFVLRMIGMSLSRIDCGTDHCVDMLPYNVELVGSIILPFALVILVTAIAAFRRPLRESAKAELSKPEPQAHKR